MRGSGGLEEKRKFYIICGHYGCGKSNFSLNLAIDRAKQGRKVMLVDLDLVNPYFLHSLTKYRSLKIKILINKKLKQKT